jgi:hypothetical protein
MVVTFDDVEMALLISLYVVLIQSLIELEPTLHTMITFYKRE